MLLGLTVSKWSKVLNIGQLWLQNPGSLYHVRHSLSMEWMQVMRFQAPEIYSKKYNFKSVSETSNHVVSVFWPL